MSERGCGAGKPPDAADALEETARLRPFFHVAMQGLAMCKPALCAVSPAPDTLSLTLVTKCAICSTPCLMSSRQMIGKLTPPSKCLASMLSALPFSESSKPCLDDWMEQEHRTNDLTTSVQFHRSSHATMTKPQLQHRQDAYAHA